MSFVTYSTLPLLLSAVGVICIVRAQWLIAKAMLMISQPWQQQGDFSQASLDARMAELERAERTMKRATRWSNVAVALTALAIVGLIYNTTSLLAHHP